MRKFFLCLMVLLQAVIAYAQGSYQLTNADFEDWSGAVFDGNIQPAGWHASNVTQLGFKFNFAHQEAGHNGGYCMMVKDQDVGAAGITETSPGYFALGKPWVYLASLTKISEATAGTSGGITWTHRPDSMSVWIRRTGDNASKEDFYLLYYAWSGTSRGDKYTGKNGKCTSHSETNEESDIRLAMNGNECGTTQKATQIAEGMWRERATYSSWTKITVPICYFNDTMPTMMNIIFSASNYPNFRANSGLYAGNSLYVDDVQLIYSSKIQELWIKGENDIKSKKWNGFDPKSSEVQVYSLGESATQIPVIEAVRGAGSLTNARGTTKTFPGRVLEEGPNKEMRITPGDLNNVPTRIVVHAENNYNDSTVYLIQFKKAQSNNAKLAGITVNGEPMTDFSPTKYNYTYELPYGTTQAPIISCTLAEDGQMAQMMQATSPTGKAAIVVTAPDNVTKQTYFIQFAIGPLKDNTLQDILLNGKSIPGFSPAQTIYKVSLPTTTTTMPTVQAVSAYPTGAQTIVYTAPATIDGGQYQIAVSTPGTPTPKVYKLNFKLEASSYSRLADLQVIGEQIANVNPGTPDDPTILAFDPEVTTYYVNLKMGTETMPQILYTPGDEFQTITKTDGGLDGTTRINVLAGNNADQTVYKLVFATAKSEISTLDGIEIGGVALENFSPDQTNYTYALPVGTTTLPEIRPIAHDEFQKISVTTGGLNGKTRITVTAGNGTTTNYYISFSVATFSDNTLADLQVTGYEIAFAPETDEYWVNLPQGTTVLPEVTYVLKNSDLQTVSVRTINGLSGDYKITVRPQSGSSRTYVIHFSIATSSNVNLGMIYVGGEALEAFNPEQTEYTYRLPEGVSTIPAVTFDKAESTQRVLSVLENKTQTITVTAESGAKREYTVTFIVQVSQNAFLNMIYLNGDSLAGFQSDVLNYEVDLQGATCPAITVDKAAGQQVTITAPYAAGVATIKVTPEEGAANVYTITFHTVAVASARLSNILVNGVGIEGFDPATTAYTLSYEGALPTVEGVKEFEAQTVKLLWKENVAWLHVQDTLGNKAAYSVTFTRTLSTNNTLEAIYADGTLIKNFDPSVLNYTDSLAAGSAYPEISYKAAANAQVVFFGQLTEGQWGITVVAEDGTLATYTVQFIIKKYNDATLANLSVEGFDISFQPTTFNYALTIDEGASLPTVTVVAREGQTVLQNDRDEMHQQILVYAEGGASNNYTISYTRVPSGNALLADILIDGVSIEGFDPMIEDYTDSIAWRSAFVPNVFPVGQLPNQTITTYYSRPNGVTRIHVQAQDGTTKDYSVTFPVRKSNNTKLGDLYLDSEEAEIAFKASKTDYEVTLPYSATECPKMVFEKDEAEQRIDVISRPIGQTSEIIVTAENGETRTYTILFKREVLKTKNLLSMIRIVELDQELSLKDKTKRDFDVTMPFGSRSLTVEYEKSYDAQTVFVQPGGVNNPTIITVKANNDTIADEIYRIIPTVPTEDPAVLTDIKVNNVTISGFQSEKFSYIVPVTEKPKLRYTLNKGAEINITYQSTKHWQAEVTYGEGAAARTNTYNVWFYYVNEQVPNTNFTNWEAAAVYTSSEKPTGWNTITDVLGKHSGFFSFTPDELCKKNGSSLELNTRYSTPGGGLIPGFVTLGSITTAGWGIAGGTGFDVSGGIPFHNSPDQMSVRYQFSNVRTSNQIQYILTGGDGQKTLEWNQTNDVSNATTFNFDLTEANNVAGDPTLLNIVLNSFFQTSGTKDESLGMSGQPKMIIDWISFSYNHKLSSIKVDGVKATKVSNSNNFSITLTDPERIELPVLSFIGEVADQAQDITWSVSTKDANYETRTATIRNFAENGTDHTDYTLTVKRPLDTKNQLANLLIDTTQIAGFAANKTDYTIVLPATRRNLPDIQPVPGSSLQTVTTVYNPADSTMTVTVTPEKGSATVYTVHFTTTRSNDVTLANIAAEGLTFAPDTKQYEIVAAQMPVISFEKKSDLQTVSLVNGVITVTAEDGSTGTYTITRVDPTVSANGTLTEFSEGLNVVSGFGNTEYEKNEAKPAEYVSFIRQSDTDSVIFVQQADKMTWTVPETGKTYTWLYPTTQSANADLAAITINGTNYAEFLPGQTEYELIEDSTLVMAAIGAEDKQTITTAYTTVEGGVEYTAQVVAENGTTKTYKVTILRPLSDDATLAGILLDSVPVVGFDPMNTHYSVTLPVGAVKTAQPKMPNITYLAGHKGQHISLEAGSLNGDQTIITVQSEDGNATNYYYLQINAEPSHCSDLTGITVNGQVLDHFEPGRHHYSVSLKTDEIVVDYTSDDRFQTVSETVNTVVTGHEYHYTLHVTAEDGTASDYLIEVYVENRSNDAQLANIYLDGKALIDFERVLNPDLSFDGGNNNYEINLPSGTTILPEVSAQLKMDGQSVEILHRHDSILLDVTAVDGTTHNIYVLRFLVPLSKNANLSMIFLNGDSLPEFTPDYYFYQIDLPVGTHNLPEIVAQKGESGQLIQPVEVNTDKLQAIIKVQAEDRSQMNTYVVVFHFTQSDADTLAMIYEDGAPLENFAPATFYYTRSLPVGTVAFPDLSWMEQDDWQTITMDTVEMTASTLVRQIMVTSESGKKNTYTVSYTILKSDIDTLQMIFVDQKQLPDFNAQTLEYHYQLTAKEASELNGELPIVEFIAGDEYQTVMVAQALDSLSINSLRYKSLITVTAATGKTRTYTIHYPVELSSDASLNMIMLGGKPLANFDSERPNYKVEIIGESAIPVVSVIKKEEAQTYEIRVMGDTVLIDVMAEDGVTTKTYLLAFERVLSSVTTLQNIILVKDEQTLFFKFEPETYEYTIVMPDDSTMTAFTLDDLPEIYITWADSLQDTLVTRTILSKTECEVKIEVKAANGDEGTPYILLFRYRFSNDATLSGIQLGGKEYEDFVSTKWEYTYLHPFGTEEADFFTEETIGVTTSNPYATYTVSVDEEGTITIHVLAQDEKAENTYRIYQVVDGDPCNTLDMIYINGVPLENFDPLADTIYVYQLVAGTASIPNVTFDKTKENISVDLSRTQPGEVLYIDCTAENGSVRTYRIHFLISDVDFDRPKPNANDVIICRYSSTQVFVATINKDVAFSMYDQAGRLIFYHRLPVADPNTILAGKDTQQLDVLLNITDFNAGMLVGVEPGEIYFYAFREGSGAIIKSGKLMVK